MGIKGIYAGVCLECEMLVFPKQSGLETGPCEWTESRVQVAS